MSMTPSKCNYFAIVLAGGSGLRFNKTLDGRLKDVPKQYQLLAGKTVLEHSVQAVCAATFPKSCIVTHAQSDQHINHQHFSWQVQLVHGGPERMHSVMNALEALKVQAAPDDLVLIHDGARPCVAREDILSLMDKTKDHPVGGLLATPLTDTIKVVDESLHTARTLDRSLLWAAQTPQLFRFRLIYDALQVAIKNNQFVTDDASALELVGHKPLIVAGSPDNIKITHARDLALAEWYFAKKN